MVLKLNEEHPDFRLTYEWAIIEHLGLNLYSEVHSAISELIANAYDAEARKVGVTLPIGVELGLPGQEVVIADDGHGMTYEECRDKFLRIGRNRRRSSTKSKNGLRTVIGKKGIGKLAGFGIADVIVVSTIAEGELNEFRLSLADLRSAPEVGGDEADQVTTDGDQADTVREYHPKLIRYKVATSRPNGTTVTLENLRRLDPIEFDEFIRQMGRKFAIFGDEFEVTVRKANSSQTRVVEKFDVPCQFRFPENGWAREVLETPGLGPQAVNYWIGFTPGTIKDDSVRGISIIANGKSVQEPFEFRVTGGLTGQFGLQYMTGEVSADWLDAPEKVDVIASDRASVRWSDLDAQALLKWGQQKVKRLLDEWVTLRATDTTEKIRIEDPDVYAQIHAYKGEAHEELKQVVDRVVSTISQVGQKRTREVVRSIVVAYSHDHVRTVLRRVLEAEGGLELFGQALDEWDLIDAVLTFQDLSVKLAALQTLRILIDAGATEVKSKSGHLSLAEHLAAHPWLIDPMFREMRHELNVDNFIRDQYGDDAPVAEDDKRLDFVALYSSDRVGIIEIKSAKTAIDERGVVNLQDYHQRVLKGERERDQSRKVRSMLIYNGDATRVAGNLLAVIQRDRDNYEVYTWRELMDRNDMIYKEMLQRVKEKNPDDPRVKPLWDSLQPRLDPAEGAAIRRQRRQP
jgi:hypothetical protein